MIKIFLVIMQNFPVGADVLIGPSEITGAKRGDEDIAPYITWLPREGGGFYNLSNLAIFSPLGMRARSSRSMALSATISTP